MADFITDGGVISTVLFLNRAWESATMYRFVDAHRFMTRHQLTITSPDLLTGIFSIRIIPDTVDSKMRESVAINASLKLDNEKSGLLVFSGVLRGVELVKESGFVGNNTITVVLSSTTGTIFEQQSIVTGPGTGDLLSTGTVPLSADWDVGPFKITGKQLASNIVAGTAPFIVASTTMVQNLNVQYLNGQASTAFASFAQGVLADSALQNASKTIIIEQPGNAEDLSFFFTDIAITATKIRVILVGSTPSITWTLRHGTDRSLAGSEIVTGGTTTTETTTGVDITVFNDATIVANSFVWFETTAKSGTIDSLGLTMFFDED